MKDSLRHRVAARDLGLRRSRAVTVWTTVGATAAATVLSVVLAEGTSAASAAPSNPAPNKPAPNKPAPNTPAQQAPAPASPAPTTTARPPATSSSTQAPVQLQPPAQQPYSYSGGGSVQGGSGGS